MRGTLKGCVVGLGLLLMPLLASAAPERECADDAVGRAQQLLELQVGEDDRIEISHEVTIASPIKNPANPEQIFDVLEVWGYIYKGRYRMRFIYARVPGVSCVLMGQEILEFAQL